MNKKLSIQVQSGSSYESNNMILLPYSEGILNQSFDSMEDDSILGKAFQNKSLQGNQHVGGEYTTYLNNDNLILLNNFDKKFSIAEQNDIETIQYSNCYFRNIKLSGSVGNLINMDLDIFSLDTPSKNGAATFPTTTNSSYPFNFQEIQYFRIGDLFLPLSSLDERSIKSFNLELITGYEEIFANGQAPISPVPNTKLNFSFVAPRYLEETFQNWQDNDTNLQLEMLIYKSISESLKIQIPNFKTKITLNDEDLTTMTVECLTGSNKDRVNPNMGVDLIDFVISTLIWWEGEDNVLDSGGNHLNGAWSGTEQYTTGYIGKCFNFNGSSYINVSHNTLLTPANLTIECYIKRTGSVGTWDPIIKKAGGGGRGQANGWALEFNSNQVRFLIYNGDTSGIYHNGWMTTAGYTITNGVWYKIKGIFDGTNLQLYVNDILIDSIVTPYPIIPSTNNLNIARDPSNTSRFFNGLIDEIKIY